MMSTGFGRVGPNNKKGIVMFEDCEVAGITVRLSISADLAMVELIGKATPQGMKAVKDYVINALSESGPVAGFLVRFDGADMECDEADLGALFDSEGPHDQATAPAAMIVRPDQLALFSAHAWQVSWRGIVRRAFVATPPAVEWLTDRARVAAEIRQIRQQAQ